MTGRARREPQIEAADIELDGQGPLYGQIRRAVAERIRNGAWRPGRRVPTEKALMARFRASRMTVHRALAALARDGLIVRRRRAGTLVAEPTAEHAVLAIPSIPEEIGQTGRTHTFEVLRRRIGPASARTAKRAGLEPGEPIVELELLHLADGKPHVLERRVIRLAAVPEAAGERFDRTPPGTWLLANVPWTEARHVVTAEAANPATARRLAIASGSPCLVLERRTWNRNSHLTTVRLVYPGARHHLVGRFGPYAESRPGQPDGGSASG
jgi:GntR family histidine utilization transcriptional repressor